jgi:hypothetical protein
MSVQRIAIRLATLPTHRVRIGGMGKQALLAELARHGIQLNDAARALFADERFTTLARRRWIQTAEVAVAGLGFPQGATLPQIIDRARGAGLLPCALELAPHLRLQLLDQDECPASNGHTAHRAPSGSITVASVPLTRAGTPARDASQALDQPASHGGETPRGFYLRRVDGILWLRGYWCDEQHVWSPEDHFVFRASRRSAVAFDSSGAG